MKNKSLIFVGIIVILGIFYVYRQNRQNNLVMMPSPTPDLSQIEPSVAPVIGKAYTNEYIDQQAKLK